MSWFRKETTWFKVMDKSEAEAIQINGVAPATANSRSLCVAHTEKGFFILNDRCPHNGFSLSKGWCSDDHAVVCPLHRYRFDLSSGRAKSGIADYVATYPSEMREDGLYMCIERTRFKFL